MVVSPFLLVHLHSNTIDDMIRDSIPAPYWHDVFGMTCFRRNMTWMEAKKSCEERNAYLPYPKTIEEGHLFISVVRHQIVTSQFPQLEYTVFLTNPVRRERHRVSIEGASSRCLNVPPPCTYADGLLHCSATVGHLRERVEPDIIT